MAVSVQVIWGRSTQLSGTAHSSEGACFTCAFACSRLQAHITQSLGVGGGALRSTAMSDGEGAADVVLCMCTLV
jgi:hypothetical protein